MNSNPRQSPVRFAAGGRQSLCIRKLPIPNATCVNQEVQSLLGFHGSNSGQVSNTAAVGVWWIPPFQWLPAWKQT